MAKASASEKTQSTQKVQSAQKALSFQKASTADVAFLLQLRIASMTEHLAKVGLVLTEQQHLERIYDFFEDSYLILYQATPVGVLKLGVKNKHLHIRQLQILPNFQNKGIGAQVLNAVKRQAKKLHLPISLNVLHGNPAKNLYSRHGFLAVGETSIEYQMVCPLALC